jgi:MFS family permease
MDTGYRMFFPLLPVIASGIGTEPAAIALLLSARSILGVALPLIGPVADLRGQKLAMEIGLLMFVSGFLLLAIKPTYVTLAIALLISAFGKMIFNPAVHAYISDNIRQSRRGLAMSFPEFGWSHPFY